NTGQLNWVGSTWATASAPPPAAPKASAMNTYSASATPTRFAPHAQGPGQSARSGRSNRLTNVPPRTISTAMLTGASTGPHHGSLGVDHRRSIEHDDLPALLVGHGCPAPPLIRAAPGNPRRCHPHQAIGPTRCPTAC